MQNCLKKEKGRAILKRAPLLLLLCGMALSLSAQQDPVKLMDKMAATFKKEAGYTIHFTMNIKQLIQHATESFDAKIDLKGENFHLVTPDTEAWYNGTTQWVLMYQSEEVNISNPTKEEAKQINPIQILNSYKKGYACVYKGERNDVKGRPSFVVELTPEKPGDIEYISVLVNKNSYAPNSILIRQKGSIETQMHINTIQKEVNFSDAAFVFDRQKHTDVEIIDLR